MIYMIYQDGDSMDKNPRDWLMIADNVIGRNERWDLIGGDHQQCDWAERVGGVLRNDKNTCARQKSRLNAHYKNS